VFVRLALLGATPAPRIGSASGNDTPELSPASFTANRLAAQEMSSHPDAVRTALVSLVVV
jgi:hypothetical protein